MSGMPRQTREQPPYVADESDAASSSRRPVSTYGDAATRASASLAPLPLSRSQSSSKSSKYQQRMEALVQNFYAKLAQIILQTRSSSSTLNSIPASTISSSLYDYNRWVFFSLFDWQIILL